MNELHIVRPGSNFTDWEALLALILRSFAYMNDRIDPPSSALLLTPQTLRQKAEAEIALLAYQRGKLAGCAFLAERDDHCYLGKLAVDPHFQRQGIGRLLFSHAEWKAHEIGKPIIELQTRVELTENQALFAKLGFIEVRRTSHPGFDRPTTITLRKALA